MHATMLVRKSKGVYRSSEPFTGTMYARVRKGRGLAVERRVVRVDLQPEEVPAHFPDGPRLLRPPRSRRGVLNNHRLADDRAWLRREGPPPAELLHLRDLRDEHELHVIQMWAGSGMDFAGRARSRGRPQKGA